MSDLKNEEETKRSIQRVFVMFNSLELVARVLADCTGTRIKKSAKG